MKRIISLFAILLLVVPCVASDKDDDGQPKPNPNMTDGYGILNACSFTTDVFSFHPRKIKTKHEAFSYGYCIGLVQGVYANASGSAFCPPDGVKMIHAMELVVAFVKAHPDLARKDAADIARWALSDEYPCPDKSVK
jgi:hypothetical protein